MSDRPELLPFVQFEFTHALGPGAGRYVVANVAPDGRTQPGPERELDVLVLDVAAAAPTHPRGLRRSNRMVKPADPLDVPVMVATHVRVAGHGDANAVREEVEDCKASPERQGKWIGEALTVLNQAIRAHRAACADPYFSEVMPGDPRAVRIGYGSPRDVGSTGWTHAFSASASATRLGHYEKNAPAEVVAAMLGGYHMVLDTDELLLRALLDLDQGRRDCAALQLHAAARMLESELRDEHLPEHVVKKVGELDALINDLAVIVNHLPLSPRNGDADELQDAAYRIRYVLDARRVALLELRA